ncbi:MAG: allantoicase [SAR324 cluster bacterium]|nr:allantoicase [SAR324 cluster bacterium]MBL7034392.1 allantoicase [SAR324 cluster bacterium]
MESEHDNRFSRQYLNLAEERLGSVVLATTDDFFARKENLIKPGRGISLPDKFTDDGKWMDGWESRRKRIPGHDWCSIRLGAPGKIRALDIDTNHFTGNFPPFASLEACEIDGDPDESTSWTELLAKSPLEGTSQNFFEISNDLRWTHVRLHIYPDGGVARLRVYGEPHMEWSTIGADEIIDLSASWHGGLALACSDQHFGQMGNLIAPGSGINMGDGWETRRRRGPGNDWVIMRLATCGIVRKLEVDTSFFKGNFPDRCSVDAANLPATHTPQDWGNDDIEWQTLLPEQKLQADHRHFFEQELESLGGVTHLRLNIFPDGGISRFRIFGVKAG